MTKKPSAKKAFTPKQKADALKERKQDLKDLKKEVVDAKDKSNQQHFGFATAVVAGGGVANFIAFQGASNLDLASKLLTTAVVGGILLGLNKDFFFINGVYKEMLRHINKEINENNEFETAKKVPDFKKLFDESYEARETKVGRRSKRKPTKVNSTSNVRTANAAIILISGIALANLSYGLLENEGIKKLRNFFSNEENFKEQKGTNQEKRLEKSKHYEPAP